MRSHKLLRLTLSVSVLLLALAASDALAQKKKKPQKPQAPATPAAEEPKLDPAAALEKAFTDLKTYDWGMAPKLLRPIDDAVVAVHGDAAAGKALEGRLAAVLGTSAPRAAKDYVCRKLMLIGTADSVPALAALLADNDLSHIGRYALERMPAPEAAQALRDALGKVQGALRIGVIGSLGARRDAQSVQPLTALLGDSDKAVAGAAAHALGNIATPPAAQALTAAAKTAPAEVKPAVADACLACAEALVAAGNKGEATALYKALLGPDQPKQVRLAATRGLLLAAGKKE